MRKQYGVWLVVICLLAFRFTQYFLTAPALQPGQQIEFTYRLLDEPKLSFGKQSFQYQGKRVELPTEPILHYGDVVKIKGSVEEQSIKNAPARLVIAASQVSVQSKGVVFALLAGVREHIQRSFNRVLSPRESGLLQGIVFGIKDGIDSQTYTQFKNAGVLHVVAASGANTSILSVLMITVLGVLLRRKWALVGTAIIVIVYAVLAGLQPSIVRASLMALIALTAGLLGRQNFALASLSITVLIMLMLSPLLLFDAGFQLSCAATAGILLLKPHLDSFTPWLPVSFTADANTTLAAQIATIPILLFTFGSFSMVSFLTNLAVLWMVPILMILGGLAALSSFILPILTPLILYLTFPLLSFFFIVVKFGSDAAFPLQVSSVPIWFIAAYYCLLIGFLTIKKPQSKSNT